jgi:hypothetical protein
MLRRMVLVGLLLCVVSRGVVAETKDAADTKGTKETSYWGDAGYGVVCVVANVLYMPAKVVYATIGTLTGGLAYILTVGDADTAQKVWSPSVGGSYVVTPAMVRGDEPILFNGPSYSND